MHDFPSLATDPSANVLRTAVLLGTYIGGITFSGSLVAYGKLQGLLSSSPLLLPGRHYINAGLLASNMLAMAAFYTDPSLSGGLAILGKLHISITAREQVAEFIFFFFGFRCNVSSINGNGCYFDGSHRRCWFVNC